MVGTIRIDNLNMTMMSIMINTISTIMIYSVTVSTTIISTMISTIGTTSTCWGNSLSPRVAAEHLTPPPSLLLHLSCAIKSRLLVHHSWSDYAIISPIKNTQNRVWRI